MNKFANSSVASSQECVNRSERGEAITECASEVGFGGGTWLVEIELDGSMTLLLLLSFLLFLRSHLFNYSTCNYDVIVILLRLTETTAVAVEIQIYILCVRFLTWLHDTEVRYLEVKDWVTHALKISISIQFRDTYPEIYSQLAIKCSVLPSGKTRTTTVRTSRHNF